MLSDDSDRGSEKDGQEAGAKCVSGKSVRPRIRRKVSRDQIVLNPLSLVNAIAIRVRENLPVRVDWTTSSMLVFWA